jgi:hypothetical protein
MAKAVKKIAGAAAVAVAAATEEFPVLKPANENVVSVGPKAITTEAELEAEIDAIGAMTPQIEAATKLLKAYSDRKEVVKAKVIELGLAQKIGAYYYAEVGEPGQTRTITDKDAMVQEMGAELFIELASVPLGLIDKYTTAAQQAKFIKTEKNGPRKFAIKKRV